MLKTGPTVKHFGEFQLYRSLRQVQELSRYQAVPLHHSPERGELFTRDNEGIKNRKATLAKVKEREDIQLAAIRQEWAAKHREGEFPAVYINGNGSLSRAGLLNCPRDKAREWSPNVSAMSQ